MNYTFAPVAMFHVPLSLQPLPSINSCTGRAKMPSPKLPGIFNPTGISQCQSSGRFAHSTAEASEKGSILEKLVLFMPKNVKKTH